MSTMLLPVPLGHVVVTQAVSEWIAADLDRASALVRSLRAHQGGHWGEVPEEDARANDEAMRVGERLLSAWTHEGQRVWIITEADRSATTILFPEEY